MRHPSRRPRTRRPSVATRPVVLALLIPALALLVLLAGTPSTAESVQRPTAANAAAAPHAGAAAPNAAAPSLRLGPGALHETRTSKTVAPGVTHLTITRGHASPDDHWTVTAGLATGEPEITALERRLRELGHTPRREAVAGPDPRGPPGRPMATAVRVGAFATADKANRLRAELVRAGLGARVHHTSEDGHHTTGPWHLDVLVLEPAAATRLSVELGQGHVEGVETVSSVARRTGALAAVNGGFYVTPNARREPGPWLAGTPGDPAGLTVVGGDLLSESVRHRPALVLPGPSGDGDGPAVRRLATRLSVTTSSGSTHTVTGLNRLPGLVPSCGGTWATGRGHAAHHDYTCGSPDDLVVITPAYGPQAPTGDGRQALLDDNGRVTALQDRLGGPVPPGGSVVQAKGAAATWLATHARPGDRLRLRDQVTDPDTRQQLRLTPGLGIVDGGPLLLRDGRTALDPVRDGWSPEAVDGHDRRTFYNEWYLRRNPRTAAGITASGHLVLMTADGRHPGHSAGLTIPEAAAVMRSLGAVDALNLDGGGSTTLVTHGRVRNTPSDPAGERPVATTLLLPPAAE
ncbi:phosphodiester glycosidase family protein [Streptomyces alkaliterrae]|uniref:Phosphodiester glycosidase family protein n=2 Tax=Streptomyces alkaliterrae TaxID=2213162 RepID=A0A7W3WUV1_9ACTN|nr:phosphodiester glycosidase family protein [Streptomyces alkaliterrae]MBB1258710.1 phosphodiester glycosidase family protein [Streptomyces alkaliterrae]